MYGMHVSIYQVKLLTINILLQYDTVDKLEVYQWPEDLQCRPDTTTVMVNK